ncbi:unnamed protein product [Linum tenue]|uniref:Uncharacterized protein n=1 Tax=Linum tenue TaxID=586396 RepID=A0AAV0I432_9ROSI|nr:unnamed protein product [Linum tenue]
MKNTGFSTPIRVGIQSITGFRKRIQAFKSELVCCYTSSLGTSAACPSPKSLTASDFRRCRMHTDPYNT